MRLGDSQMDLVAPFCRLVEGLLLWECGVSVGKLVEYLRGGGGGAGGTSWSGIAGYLPVEITDQGIETDDRTIAQPLDMTHRLATLLLSEAMQLTGNFLETLPIICPELKRLTMTACDAIPTSAYTALFQSAADTNHRLRLEQLCLDRCNLNDQALYHIATSQADSLLEFTTICLSDGRVTDIGMKDVLSRCHRLTSFNILGKLTITTAFMANEEMKAIPPTRVHQQRRNRRDGHVTNHKPFEAVGYSRAGDCRSWSIFWEEKKGRRFGGFDDGLGVARVGGFDCGCFGGSMMSYFKGFLGIEDEENQGHQERQAEKIEAGTNNINNHHRQHSE